MLIVCPSCSSRYELDAAKLGPAGRKVRCASCQTSWHVDPAQEDFPEAPSAAETQALLNEELERASEIDAQISAVASEHTDTVEALPPQPRKPGKGKHSPANGAQTGQPRPRHAATFVALGLGGAALLGLLVWQRNLAVRGAPQLAIVFEKLGLPINVRGLSWSAVESGLVEDGQNRFLVVEGDVTNISKGRAPMPPIEVAVKDAAGQTLYTWTTEPPRPSLEPAELVRFRARLASPPEAGKSVLVRFTSAKPAGLASAH
ncbi:MJ0042 family finger-like domain-containing protein [Bosea sp. OK403]|jgi:predicted Zn finger-like uncharacterized protein|uniref:zinc-ribbon domain-containing protein n=1 Tax=Bosea sp. OK403 TaxID=1855286 RepID=UPI0008E0E53A|nr:zinc-ribbon domain-containing protein [Bosea sp. OK403]SFJ43672.1 MJ0042 family finger-like domain-containing protein [Bosea sp. OK403]